MTQALVVDRRVDIPALHQKILDVIIPVDGKLTVGRRIIETYRYAVMISDVVQ